MLMIMVERRYREGAREKGERERKERGRERREGGKGEFTIVFPTHLEGLLCDL